VVINHILHESWTDVCQELTAVLVNLLRLVDGVVLIIRCILRTLYCKPELTLDLFVQLFQFIFVPFQQVFEIILCDLKCLFKSLQMDRLTNLGDLLRSRTELSRHWSFWDQSSPLNYFFHFLIFERVSFSSLI